MVSRSSRAGALSRCRSVFGSNARGCFHPLCRCARARVAVNERVEDFVPSVAGGCATPLPVYFVRCNTALCSGGARRVALLPNSSGLDPLISTKEPAYFVIALPRMRNAGENYRELDRALSSRSLLRGLSTSSSTWSSRALGIARVHDRLRRELRVPFPLMRNFRKAEDNPPRSVPTASERLAVRTGAQGGE